MPSTVIATMEYKAAERRLRVTFVSGMVYEYKDVPEEVYQAMKTSGAKGIYLNRHIKGKFDFEKVR